MVSYISSGAGASMTSYLMMMVIIKVYSVLIFVMVMVFLFSVYCFSEWEYLGFQPSLEMGEEDLGDQGEVEGYDFFSYFCMSIPIISSMGILSFTVNCLSLVSSFLETGFYIHIVGFQWGWEFFYPSYDFGFMSSVDANWNILEECGEFTLIIPVKTSCSVALSSVDVMHSFGVDSLGVKLDAVPGHLNTCVFDVEFEGTDNGICSEFCGEGHSYMSFKMDFVSYLDAFMMEVLESDTEEGVVLY